jgi:FdhD protein
MTTAHADHRAVREIDIVRVDGSRTERVQDGVAVEAPLEVRLGGEPFSVIMRTPGDDRHLVLGFLLSEGVITRVHDVLRMVEEPAAQALDVVLRPEAVSRAGAPPAAAQRRVLTNSSCGMCGRPSLASLDLAAGVFPLDWTVEASVVASLPPVLRSVQTAFDHTGGLHAAGLFGLDGRLLASAEDVGRHNAVDKLLGRMFVEGRLPLDRTLLFVSGRSSFEIVQKAWLGGIRFLAAVSAPSSMAVEFARERGMTLLGFVRAGRFNVYAHDSRLSRSVP